MLIQRIRTSPQARTRGGLCLGAVFLLAAFFTPAASVWAQEMHLAALIEEAMQSNPDILAAKARIDSARRRVPQAGALPDPSVGVSYTNEGLSYYTYGRSNDAVWNVSVSQTVPFPGKLSQKKEVAAKETEILEAQLHALRQLTASRIKDFNYDLFLAHRTLALLKDRGALLDQVEQAALARYASGMGDQRDAMMAQTEKYMLLEKAEMTRQKLSTLEGMLNAALGRDVNAPVGMPVPPTKAPYHRTYDELLTKAVAESPEARTREKRLEKSKAKVIQAKREFLPDLTFTGGYGNKGFKIERDPSLMAGSAQKWSDMWTLGVAVTVPLYFWEKQLEGLKESNADQREAQHELQAARNMIAAAIRENFAMVRSAQKLAELYASGAIPKTRQDFDLALASYAGGKGDIASVLARLKALLESEIQYWTQLVEKSKAIARLESLTGFSAEAPSPQPPAEQTAPAAVNRSEKHAHPVNAK